MKELKFSFLLLLFTFAFSSCNQDSLVTNDTKKEVHKTSTEIDSRSSKDDCFAFLERFIPDTKEELDYLDNLEEGKALSKEDLDAFVKLYDFENLDDFEKFVNEYVALDCVTRMETKIAINNDCGDQLYWCIHAALLSLPSINIFNVYNALSNFHTIVTNCALAYVDCVTNP